LIKAGITSPENLGIGGGSNGGLLVAATQLQRPDLFGAAIPEVGVYDMARFAQFTGGHHWIHEYGEVEKPNLFKVMMTYWATCSPDYPSGGVVHPFGGTYPQTRPRYEDTPGREKGSRRA